ncbi:MAG: trypsin-like serine protease [Myxococcales bacterium]
MRTTALVVTGLVGGLVLSACSSGGGEALDTEQESIVRPTSDGGRNQVMLVYAIVFNGDDGTVTTRTCSGAYFAPRVVATAAHCLDADPARSQSVLQVLTYFGDDFTADFSQLTPFGLTYQVPAPGQPSNWSAGDSFEVHPNWDRNLKHPDLGVVYLDRKPPIDPLPLARFPLDRSWLNREAIISGWGANVATGPTTATGSQVQRTGRTRLLGSPTAADYHADDPNPGMLVPSVRNRVIKTDGRAPYSNACFGDSGGPLLVTQRGQTYVAGIEYFGGLYCEDYSLFTRVDPFLCFFDEAQRKGGEEPLVPTYDCSTANADGTLTAFFGYKNQNGVSVSVPYGGKNSLALDTASARPNLFRPGEHHFVFGVDYTPAETIKYKLNPDSSPTTVLHVDKNSRRCGSADQPTAVCGQSCRGQLQSSCTGLQPYEQCIGGCTGFYDVFGAPQCNHFLDDWNTCLAATAPGADNWTCFPESAPGAGDGAADAPACTSFVDSFFECAFGG